jgi:hypothetical protein
MARPDGKVSEQTRHLHCYLCQCFLLFPYNLQKLLAVVIIFKTVQLHDISHASLLLLLLLLLVHK